MQGPHNSSDPADSSADSLSSLSSYREWPHSPSHLFLPEQAYIVTCGTYLKERLLNSPVKLSLVRNALFDHAEEFGWNLEAWAIMSNHYHFVAQSPENPKNLSAMLQSLHSKTAIDLNRLDQADGRKVWYQYRDTCLSHMKCYLARLHYVHQNPAHHGVVKSAADYPWCSMSWFVQRSGPGFRRTVLSFKLDKVNVPDDY